MLGFDRRDLSVTWNFFKMGLRDRYLGSRFGAVWAVLNPLIMLSIFTFVFGFVLKVRLPGAETTLAYATWLISGYGPWLAVTESIMSATTSVSSAAGLIKNMAFKSELLPIAGALLGVVPLAVSLIFLLILLAVDANWPSWHVLLVPLVVAVQFAFVAAVGTYLAAVNVFVRDLGLVLPNVLMTILFFSPIFYALESMPPAVQQVSVFNPFYILADGYRAAMVRHEMPNLLGLAYVSVLAAALGCWSLGYFRRVKQWFDAAM
jgi:lipopolysaccharide transport system permease protein